MMPTIKWKTGELFQRLDQIKKRTTVEMAKGAKDVIDRFHTTMVQTRLSAHAPNSLGARTGQLRNALQGEVKVRGRDITGRVYFRGKKANMLARVHEFGAVIHPKGDWLKVPLPGGLTPTKRPNKAFRVRDRKTQFIARSKAGNLIIFKRQGKGKRRAVIPIAVLKKSVKIPKRLYFFLTWKQFRPEARRILKGAQRRAYRRAA